MAHLHNVSFYRGMVLLVLLCGISFSHGSEEDHDHFYESSDFIDAIFDICNEELWDGHACPNNITSHQLEVLFTKLGLPADHDEEHEHGGGDFNASECKGPGELLEAYGHEHNESITRSDLEEMAPGLVAMVVNGCAGGTGASTHDHDHDHRRRRRGAGHASHGEEYVDHIISIVGTADPCNTSAPREFHTEDFRTLYITVLLEPDKELEVHHEHEGEHRREEEEEEPGCFTVNELLHNFNVTHNSSDDDHHHEEDHEEEDVLTHDQFEEACAAILYMLVNGQCSLPSSENSLELINSLFDEYGDRTTGMTLERLEDMMLALGLSAIDAHAGHNHRRRTVGVCYTGTELLTQLGLNPPVLYSQFPNVASALLAMVEGKYCGTASTTSSMTDEEIYGYSVLAAFIISVSSLLVILAVPFFKSGGKLNEYTIPPRVLSCLISLAAGTLFSDAILHLFPIAWELHSHGEGSGGGHDYSYLWKGVVAVGCTWLFYSMDVIISLVTSNQENRNVLVKTSIEFDVKDSKLNGVLTD